MLLSRSFSCLAILLTPKPGHHDRLLLCVHVHMMRSWCRRLEGSTDIDAPLTLLADVGALQDWLRSESIWGDAADRAEEVFRRLLGLLPFKEVAERDKQRWMCPAAYQLLRQVGAFSLVSVLGAVVVVAKSCAIG